MAIHASGTVLHSRAIFDGVALAIGTPAYVVQKSLPDLANSSAQ